ncbi:c-type cytochrome [Evansella sp. AB-rgal1]|uniref:c-type cytochrome n=1 Tax=Evansella sp. AB-rgal1 TaxID=3242696 RepID=UPI00359E5EE7
MKKLLVAILSAVLVLGACGGNDVDEPQTADENNMEQGATGDLSYDLDNAKQVYRQNCAGCHGGDLGGASGPPLLGYTKDEVLEALGIGPGPMTPNMIVDQDAEDVAAWIEDQQ